MTQMDKTEFLRHELSRLANPRGPTEAPSGVGVVRYVVGHELPGELILTNARSVLAAVDESYLQQPGGAKVLRSSLPHWFTQAFEAPLTDEQAAEQLRRWRNMNVEERAASEQNEKWSIDAWLYWMDPTNREWFWWDAVVLSVNHSAVAVEVTSWPFAWGAFRWLLKASGASRVDPE